MQDAQYFRKQAALCLEMARQMSDKRTAAYLRMFACHYSEKAAKLGNELEPVSTPPHPMESDDRRYKSEFAVRTKDLRSAQEKRAYYRLLRHLLGNELQVSYKEDQARPLPPQMADLLKTLFYPKQNETH